MEFCLVLFFFFKQKTAYEMRISDWSSDVCSSDLVDRLAGVLLQVQALDADLAGLAVLEVEHDGPLADDGVKVLRDLIALRQVGVEVVLALEHRRSEEHTSELQSLMRISYAVFCLKKKI